LLNEFQDSRIVSSIRFFTTCATYARCIDEWNVIIFFVDFVDVALNRLTIERLLELIGLEEWIFFDVILQNKRSIFYIRVLIYYLCNSYLSLLSILDRHSLVDKHIDGGSFSCSWHPNNQYLIVRSLGFCWLIF